MSSSRSPSKEELSAVGTAATDSRLPASTISKRADQLQARCAEQEQEIRQLREQKFQVEKEKEIFLDSAFSARMTVKELQAKSASQEAEITELNENLQELQDKSQNLESDTSGAMIKDMEDQLAAAHNKAVAQDAAVKELERKLADALTRSDAKEIKGEKPEVLPLQCLGTTVIARRR